MNARRSLSVWFRAVVCQDKQLWKITDPADTGTLRTSAPRSPHSLSEPRKSWGACSPSKWAPGKNSKHPESSVTSSKANQAESAFGLSTGQKA